MKTTRLLIVALTILMAALASMPALRADDKALLIELDRPGGALPLGVSATGTVVVGGLGTGGGFYWMPTTGAIFNGGLQALGVSKDGLTIVGEVVESRLRTAAIWLRGTEWRALNSFQGAVPCDNRLSNALGTSADGQVVVGFAWNGCGLSHAFRWQESTGMVDLGSSVAGKTSTAYAVSGDGTVVVGDQEDSTGFARGARWVNGRQELMPGPVGFVGPALAANSDGSIIVGRGCRPGPDLDQSGWLWTAEAGTTCLPPPRRLVSPGPLVIGEAAATSDDGGVIGGSQNIAGSPDSNAVIWIDGQPAYLKDFLQANGVPDAFRTWINTGTITGISPDGRVLVGYGAALGGFRGYMVILGSSRVIP
jgi:probable HAF family extracellular repeat protein